MQMEGNFGGQGDVTLRVIRAPNSPVPGVGPGWRWKLANTLRWAFIWGWLTTLLAKHFSALTGVVTITTDLRLKLYRANGEVIDFGIVARRVITDAGVAFIVDAWQNTLELEIMKYHGLGTGTASEAVGDTALGTESTTALNPDSTRGTGTLSEPAANQIRSVATNTFDASAAVTEHGVFSQAATGGGTLWDRSVFSAVNVANGDSIQSTYTATLNSGG